MKKECLRCGSEFESRQGDWKKYCSPKCGRQERRGTTRRWEKMKPSHPCEPCGSVFKPRLRTSRFCTRECLYALLSSPLGPAWRGGRVIRADGYVHVMDKGNPAATRDGYVLEHRSVMAKHLGRPLEKHETVHHINGDKADNRIENLQLRSGRHGKGVVHQCVDCGSRNVAQVPL